MVSHDRVRFLVTSCGTGIALSLMLFLAGTYEGVKTESNGYVASRPAGAWLAQGQTSNLMRATSFMNSAWVDIIRESPVVGSASPLLRIVTQITVRGVARTAFVCGIQPDAPATRPTVVEGRADLEPGDMIVDRALARKAGLGLGDTVTVQDREFRVIGLSAGTNAILTQFVFIPLEDATALLPSAVRYVVSFIHVTPKPGVTTAALIQDLRGRQDELNVLSTEEFVDNNLNEMRSGLLPILSTVGVFGGMVGATVLTLLLYSSVIERREDYALLKAVGAGRTYLRGLVVGQCLAAVTWGFLFGLAICIVVEPILAHAVPVFVFTISWKAAAWIGLAALVMGLLSAWLPLRMIERIYPAEVFRA
jgi:putative ABC transport system permease protein